MITTPAEVRAILESMGIGIKESDLELAAWFDESFLKACGIAVGATGARSDKAVIAGAGKPNSGNDDATSNN